MENANRVCGFEGAEDLPADADHLRWRKGHPPLPLHLMEALALEQLHREPAEVVVGAAHRARLHDVRVAQGHRRFGLAVEAGDVAGLLGEIRMEDLDGDDVTLFVVRRAEDGTHAAFVHALPHEVSPAPEGASDDGCIGVEAAHAVNHSSRKPRVRPRATP